MGMQYGEACTVDYNYRADLGKWQTADPLGYPDGWNQLAYCNNGVVRDVDYFGCFSLSVEGAIREKFKEKLDELVNKENVEEILRIFYKSVPADDIHVNGFISLQVTSITIYYNHFVSGSCKTSPDDYKFSEVIDFVVKRSKPDIYTLRNESGDRDGSSWKIGNGIPGHLDIPLSMTDSFLGYTVTVTRITFDFNLITDGRVRYFNFKKE